MGVIWDMFRNFDRLVSGKPGAVGFLTTGAILVLTENKVDFLLFRVPGRFATHTGDSRKVRKNWQINTLGIKHASTKG